MQEMPDRDRWSGWVGFVWFIAVLTFIGSMVLVSKLGIVEVRVPTLYGSGEIITQPNLVIWSLAIGQTIGAVLLAVLFSMVNSIYKNSCTQLRAVQSESPADKKAPQQEAESDPRRGLRLTNVKKGSPLAGVMQTGCILVSVNDRGVDSVAFAERQVINGPNKIVFYPLSGTRQTKFVELTDRDLHIEGEPTELPEA